MIVVIVVTPFRFVNFGSGQRPVDVANDKAKSLNGDFRVFFRRNTQASRMLLIAFASDVEPCDDLGKPTCAEYGTGLFRNDVRNFSKIVGKN